MNNESAKEILSAYRPDGSDAQNEIFKQALEQCQRDPGLRAWFTDQVQFDASIVRGLRDVRGPAEGKQAILAFANLENGKSRESGWRKVIPFMSIGIAAMLLLMIGLFNKFATSQGAADFDGANFSVSELVSEAMPLDHRSSDRTELVNWLEERNAPVPPELPEIFQMATVEGCRIFADGNGGKVSLFCFTMDGELVHVLTFDEQTRPYLKQPKGEWWSEGDWNMVAFEADQNLFAVATKLPVEKLSKYM